MNSSLNSSNSVLSGQSSVPEKSFLGNFLVSLFSFLLASTFIALAFVFPDFLIAGIIIGIASSTVFFISSIILYKKFVQKAEDEKKQVNSAKVEPEKKQDISKKNAEPEKKQDTSVVSKSDEKQPDATPKQEISSSSPSSEFAKSVSTDSRTDSRPPAPVPKTSVSSVSKDSRTDSRPLAPVPKTSVSSVSKDSRTDSRPLAGLSYVQKMKYVDNIVSAQTACLNKHSQTTGFKPFPDFASVCLGYWAQGRSKVYHSLSVNRDAEAVGMLMNNATFRRNALNIVAFVLANYQKSKTCDPLFLNTLFQGKTLTDEQNLNKANPRNKGLNTGASRFVEMITMIYHNGLSTKNTQIYNDTLIKKIEELLVYYGIPLSDAIKNDLDKIARITPFKDLLDLEKASFTKPTDYTTLYNQIPVDKFKSYNMRAMKYFLLEFCSYCKKYTHYIWPLMPVWFFSDAQSDEAKIFAMKNDLSILDDPYIISNTSNIITLVLFYMTNHGIKFDKIFSNTDDQRKFIECVALSCLSKDATLKKMAFNFLSITKKPISEFIYSKFPTAFDNLGLNPKGNPMPPNQGNPIPSNQDRYSLLNDKGNFYIFDKNNQWYECDANGTPLNKGPAYVLDTNGNYVEVLLGFNGNKTVPYLLDSNNHPVQLLFDDQGRCLLSYHLMPNQGNSPPPNQGNSMPPNQGYYLILDDQYNPCVFQKDGTSYLVDQNRNPAPNQTNPYVLSNGKLVPAMLNQQGFYVPDPNQGNKGVPKQGNPPPPNQGYQGVPNQGSPVPATALLANKMKLDEDIVKKQIKSYFTTYFTILRNNNLTSQHDDIMNISTQNPKFNILNGFILYLYHNSFIKSNGIRQGLNLNDNDMEYFRKMITLCCYSNEPTLSQNALFLVKNFDISDRFGNTALDKEISDKYCDNKDKADKIIQTGKFPMVPELRPPTKRSH